MSAADALHLTHLLNLDTRLHGLPPTWEAVRYTVGHTPTGEPVADYQIRKIGTPICDPAS